jgi:hypothetical protein
VAARTGAHLDWLTEAWLPACGLTGLTVEPESP